MLGRGQGTCVEKSEGYRDLFGETASSARQRGRFSSRDLYLDEARALYGLLTDGHPSLGYHVSRTYALRDLATRKALHASWVESGVWRPAREVDSDGTEHDRVFNPYVLQKHVLGNYDVAWQMPSWTSLVVFDIDRHLPGRRPEADVPYEIVVQANEQRDRTLAKLWAAFGFYYDKQPVVLQTPSGGYHVYLPLCRRADDPTAERTWPAAWVRERIEHHLNQAGLELSPGTLELFPSGVRLRAPCGLGQTLLHASRSDDESYLGLVPTAGTTRMRDGRLCRRIGPMVRAFCQQIAARRRPLDAWLEMSRSAWHAVWGPFGERCDQSQERPTPKKTDVTFQGVIRPSQHNVDVKGGGACRPSLLRSGGLLLRGADFVQRVRDLSLFGLTEPGQRHDAALKLVWYWGCVRGLGRGEVLVRLREWLEGFSHESQTRKVSPARFVTATLAEAAHYFDRHVACGSSRPVSAQTDVCLRMLSDRDQAWVKAKVFSEVRSEVTLILRYLKGFADASGRVPREINLSSKIMSSFCGERRIQVSGADGRVQRRRATVLAIGELVRLGVLALHTDYSTGRHGRLYTCWYQFSTGTLPREDASGGLVLASRRVEEGRLDVVSDAKGHINCVLVADSVAVGQREDSWWQRMYQRRVFTPAEFHEGDARKLIPGPFRHSYRRSTPTKPAKSAARPALSVHPPPVACEVEPDERASPAHSEEMSLKDSLARAIDAAWEAFERYRPDTS